MPEWLKGADCKSAAFRYVGSNPTRPIFTFCLEVMAQFSIVYGNSLF